MSSEFLAAHFAAETAAHASSQIVTKLAARLAEEACQRASAQALDAVQQLTEASLRKATLAAAQAAAKVATVEIINVTTQIAAEAAARAVQQLESSGLIESICTRTAERATALVAASMRDQARIIAQRAQRDVQSQIEKITRETTRSAVEIGVRSAQMTLHSARTVSLEAHNSALDAADRIAEANALTPDNFLIELEREINTI